MGLFKDNQLTRGNLKLTIINYNPFNLKKKINKESSMSIGIMDNPLTPT